MNSNIKNTKENIYGNNFQTEYSNFNSRLALNDNKTLNNLTSYQTMTTNNNFTNNNNNTNTNVYAQLAQKPSTKNPQNSKSLNIKNNSTTNLVNNFESGSKLGKLNINQKKLSYVANNNQKKTFNNLINENNSNNGNNIYNNNYASQTNTKKPMKNVNSYTYISIPTNIAASTNLLITGKSNFNGYMNYKMIKPQKLNFKTKPINNTSSSKTFIAHNNQIFKKSSDGDKYEKYANININSSYKHDQHYACLPTYDETQTRASKINSNFIGILSNYKNNLESINNNFKSNNKNKNNINSNNNNNNNAQTNKPNNNSNTSNAIPHETCPDKDKSSINQINSKKNSVENPVFNFDFSNLKSKFSRNENNKNNLSNLYSNNTANNTVCNINNPQNPNINYTSLNTNTTHTINQTFYNNNINNSNNLNSIFQKNVSRNKSFHMENLEINNNNHNTNIFIPNNNNSLTCMNKDLKTNVFSIVSPDKEAQKLLDFNSSEKKNVKNSRNQVSISTYNLNKLNSLTSDEELGGKINSIEKNIKKYNNGNLKNSLAAKKEKNSQGFNTHINMNNQAEELKKIRDQLSLINHNLLNHQSNTNNHSFNNILNTQVLNVNNTKVSNLKNVNNNNHSHLNLNLNSNNNTPSNKSLLRESKVKLENLANINNKKI